MPELPEVETIVRRLRHSVAGREIRSVWAAEDSIVFRGKSPAFFQAHLKGRTVEEVGRKGKYFWLKLDDSSYAIGHLGMSGWVHQVPENAERPRFAKLDILFGEAIRFVLTDLRRLGRFWISEDAESDKTIKALGFDSFNSLPKAAELAKTLAKRHTSIKAVLLDQKVFAGVGNYLADEVLYQSKISPKRQASDLELREITRLRKALSDVLEKAVEAESDENRYPEDWLFHHRWGGKRGDEMIGKHKIVRETVAGRTTAWVPSIQK